MPVPIVEILLVEDNPAHVDLTREAFGNSKYVKTIHAVTDGDEALDYLHHRGKYKNATLPDLILLDLNLPKKDGREVLAEIKADGRLKHIPVVILSTSSAEKDIRKAYQLYANCYIAKPVRWDSFQTIVKTIEDFWFSVASLPHNDRA